jgi:hypothetical protein
VGVSVNLFKYVDVEGEKAVNVFVDVGGFACAGEYLWCLNVWVRVRVWA